VIDAAKINGPHSTYFLRIKQLSRDLNKTNPHFAEKNSEKEKKNNNKMMWN